LEGTFKKKRKEGAVESIHLYSRISIATYLQRQPLRHQMEKHTSQSLHISYFLRLLMMDIQTATLLLGLYRPTFELYCKNGRSEYLDSMHQKNNEWTERSLHFDVRDSKGAGIAQLLLDSQRKVGVGVLKVRILVGFELSKV
jgi:hypothetical protein